MPVLSSTGGAAVGLSVRHCPGAAAVALPFSGDPTAAVRCANPGGECAALQTRGGVRGRRAGRGGRHNTDSDDRDLLPQQQKVLTYTNWICSDSDPVIGMLGR